MPNSRSNPRGFFTITKAEWNSLIAPENNPENGTKFILYFVGALLTPVALAGAFLGYARAYNRLMKPKDLPPDLSPLLPAVRVAMILGVIVTGFLAYFLWLFAYTILFVVFVRLRFSNIPPGLFLLVNLVVSFFLFVTFNRWRVKHYNALIESQRFGTARFARAEELDDLLTTTPGLYVGGRGYKYFKQGHLLTVAGTRGGKGVNLIIPNLLGKGGYEGSFVVIDPKGENAAITARYQRQAGKEVLVLDPWNLVTKPGEQSNYNPLDLLQKKDEDALVDDASVIAEMIVPPSSGKDQFFNDRARSIITGMIIHLIISEKEDGQTLGKIWKWLRLDKEGWSDLLADMCVSNNEVVQATGKEVLNLMATALETYGSVMSSALQYTDFLKSPALQKSLVKSNFNINSLSAGKTTLYIVIPADKLKSHYQWLRLVVTTALRSVIRNKNKRVTFILDEFAALGTLSEIEVALSTYAGYNVTIWAILQSLIQLQDKYGQNWETFLGNTAVKHFFNVGDNFTANYLSTALGQKSFVTYEKTATGMSEPKATARALVTSDEVRRGSADNIFTIIEQRHPTYFGKLPYFEMRELQGKYDENPYHTGS